MDLQDNQLDVLHTDDKSNVLLESTGMEDLDLNDTCSTIMSGSTESSCKNKSDDVEKSKAKNEDRNHQNGNMPMDVEFQVEVEKHPHAKEPSSCSNKPDERKQRQRTLGLTKLERAAVYKRRSVISERMHAAGIKRRTEIEKALKLANRRWRTVGVVAAANKRREEAEYRKELACVKKKLTMALMEAQKLARITTLPSNAAMFAKLVAESVKIAAEAKAEAINTDASAADAKKEAERCRIEYEAKEKAYIEDNGVQIELVKELWTKIKETKKGWVNARHDLFIEVEVKQDECVVLIRLAKGIWTEVKLDEDTVLKVSENGNFAERSEDSYNAYTAAKSLADAAAATAKATAKKAEKKAVVANANLKAKRLKREYNRLLLQK